MSALAVELPEKLKADFGRRPVVKGHGLQDHELFTDEALIELLDHFPREHLYSGGLEGFPMTPATAPDAASEVRA